MTNEKDREMPRCTLSDEALADNLTEWAIKLAKTGGGAWDLRVPVDWNHDPDMLMTEAADRLRFRAEAVKAERERCIIKIRSLAYEGKGMTNYGADQYNEALGDAEDAILSDDQEATPGKGQGGTCASCAKFGKCGRDSWCEGKEWEEGRG